MQLSGAGEALALLTEGDQQTRRQVRSCPGQCTEECIIGERRRKFGDLSIKAIDRFERRAQLLDQDLYLKPEGTDYDLISGKCRGGLDGPYALLDDVGEAHIVIAKEPLQTGPVSAVGGVVRPDGSRCASERSVAAGV